jgi:hypothetical protein
MRDAVVEEVDGVTQVVSPGVNPWGIKFMRMLEDNLDLQNDPRKIALRGACNLDDLFSAKVGGVWRVDQPDAINLVPTPQIQQQAQQLLDYYDKKRGERSGMDPNAQGITAKLPEESMNTAVERVLSMKEEMTGLVIRVFCETGIKQLFLKLRGLLMRHQNKAETVQLRNKWVEINPGNWIERANTTTVVGLGTGDRLKKAAGLREILAYQKELAAGGFMGPLVSSERIGHTLKELIRVQGLGDPDDFLLDPAQLTKENPAQISPRGQEAIRAMQQQQQQAEQAAQMEQQKAQAQQQAQMALVQVQVEMENIKAQAKLMEAQIRKQTADEDRMAEMMQAMKELEFKYSELAATVSTEQAKTSAKAGTDIMQAGIQLEIAEKQSQVAKETAAQRKPTNDPK